MHKGYKCLDRSSGRIYISRDVVFDEVVFPFASSSTPSDSISTSSLFPSEEPAISNDHMQHYRLDLLLPNGSLEPPFATVSGSTGSRCSDDPPAAVDQHSSATDDVPPPHTEQHSISPTNCLASPSAAPAPPKVVAEESTFVSIPSGIDAAAPQMVTRSKHNIHKPRIHADGTILYNPSRRAFFTTPSSYKTALADDKWCQAMQNEFLALRQNNTWTLVPKPPGQNIISCKWVFRVKQHPDGSIDKLKARLVARGFTQQYGIDYHETFSPVVKPATVRLVLSLAVSRGWHTRQIDISNAFLHGFLDDTTYMQQPPGFQDASRPDYVCKLHKSIYGLKQSPRAWYSRLSERLYQLGFSSSVADSSLFIYLANDITMFMLVYVDDIVITSSSPEATRQLLQQLSVSFPVKDLGQLNYFLGIEVTYNSGGMTLTQQKYARDILSRVHMENCKSAATPLCATEKLSRAIGKPLTDKDAFVYRSTVGALQYLTLTRPDLSFSVNKVCQFPLQTHGPALGGCQAHTPVCKRNFEYWIVITTIKI
jgi:hypothetical protein